MTAVVPGAAGALAVGGVALAAADAVEVVGLDGHDVVVVAQLAGLGGEAEVGDRGDGDVGVRGIQREAVVPGVLRLVLQVQGQGLVLEVGQAGFGGDGGASEATGL